jgi:hypothetical protein
VIDAGLASNSRRAADPIAIVYNSLALRTRSMPGEHREGLSKRV